MKFKSVVCLLLGLICALPLRARESVYACGGFNGWDALNPAEFEYREGLYVLEIDFSLYQDFKISTSKGETGNGWSEFDRGTLAVEGTPSMNRWLSLYRLQASPNITAPEKRKIKVVIDLDAMLINFGGEGERPTTWSGTLPVLFINTSGGAPVVDKETYLDATYYLDPMGLEGVEAIGSKEVPMSTQIKGRGNYSWIGFDKKPYRLKLAEKQPLAGMPSSRHFVLLAHADDRDGFLRNETGFALSRMLEMPWTPKSVPVELVLNGNYRGLYFLTENIRVAKDRVNIVEQEDLATQDVDGGWLVEIDNYDTDPHITVFEEGRSDSPIWFTYKSPEELSIPQQDYLQNAMQSVDNAVYSNQKDAADPELGRLVDLDILARYYITQEIVDDCESFHGSCYLNRNRGEEQKWKFGPVWDFGNAFNRRRTDMFIWQDPPFHQVWIGEIYKYEAFQTKLKEVWSQYLGYGPERLRKELEAFTDKIYVAAQYDARRWPDYGNPDIKANLKAVWALIEAKTEWLKTKWGSVSGVSTPSQKPTETSTDVYNLQGIKVLSGASQEQINSLPAGVYITPQGKFLKR